MSTEDLLKQFDNRGGRYDDRDTLTRDLAAALRESEKQLAVQTARLMRYEAALRFYEGFDGSGHEARASLEEP